MKPVRSISCLAIAILMLVAGPVAAGGLGLPSSHWGLGFGNLRDFTGLRLNLRDDDVDRVGGVNVTLWAPKREGGHYAGLGLHLVGLSAHRFDGVALSLLGSEIDAGSGIFVNGLGMEGGDLEGILVNGLGAGLDDFTGVAVALLGLGAGDVTGITLSGLGMGADEVTGIHLAAAALGAGIDTWPAWAWEPTT